MNLKDIDCISPINKKIYLSKKFTFSENKEIIGKILNNTPNLEGKDIEKLHSEYLNSLKNRQNNDIYIKVENYIKGGDILNINIEDLNKINNNLLKILFYSELKKRYPKNEIEEELIVELNGDLLFSSFINRYDKIISIKNEKIANGLYFEKGNEKFGNIIFDSSSFDNEQFGLEIINLLGLFDLKYTTELNGNKKYSLTEEKYNIFKNYFSTIRRINSLEDISNFTLKEQNKYLGNIDKIHDYLDPEDILKFIINNGINLNKGNSIKERIKNTIIEYKNITPANLEKIVEKNKNNYILDKIMPLYESNYTDKIFLKYIREGLTEIIEKKDFKKFHFLSIGKSNISGFFEQKKYDNKTESDYFYLGGLNSKTNLGLGFPLFKERVNTLGNRYDLVLEVALTIGDKNNEDAEFLIKKYEELGFKANSNILFRKDSDGKTAYEYLEMKRHKNNNKSISDGGYSKESINSELQKYSYIFEEGFIESLKELNYEEGIVECIKNIEKAEKILNVMNTEKNKKTLDFDESKNYLKSIILELYDLLEKYKSSKEIWSSNGESGNIYNGRGYGYGSKNYKRYGANQTRVWHHY